MTMSKVGRLVVVVSAFALSACSSNSGATDDPSPSAQYDDEDSADPAEVEKGGETRDAYEERQADIDDSRGTYFGDTCTVDCGGHDAGREWAERRGVTEPSECGGKSWSFQEGCETYAREQQGEDSEE